MTKHKSSPTDGLDIATALLAFKNDLMLEVRQTLHPDTDTSMWITTTVYRDTDGVKIGIWRETVRWSSADVPLPAKLLGALHRAYWKASDLAHSGQRPGWAIGSG